MFPGLEEVALYIKCSVGPRSIIPPDHYNHALPGVPYMVHVCPIIVFGA